MIKPFIDLGGEAIQLLTTALGRLLLGVDEPDPQTRCPGISNLPPVPLSASLELVTGDEVGRLGNRGGSIAGSVPTCCCPSNYLFAGPLA